MNIHRGHLKTPLVSIIIIPHCYSSSSPHPPPGNIHYCYVVFTLHPILTPPVLNLGFCEFSSSTEVVCTSLGASGVACWRSHSDTMDSHYTEQQLCAVSRLYESDILNIHLISFVHFWLSWSKKKEKVQLDNNKRPHLYTVHIYIVKARRK